MEYLQSQDGNPFIRAVAQYIRQHEKALANSLQLTVQRRKTVPLPSSPSSTANSGAVSQSSTGTLAAALSFAGLHFKSHNVKSAQLTLTPHHLFYLLSRAEELDVDVGPMNIRVESIHNDSTPANYVSFLQTHKPPRGRSDADSIHSVSSVRSVMSGMSAFWSSSSTGSKSEKARLAIENDMKYIYGAFTKLPSLRLTPDHRTPLIKGYEQFPFDTAVPLFAFKNLQQLEIADIDFRSFYGWDRLADQLCLLTIKRGKVDDPIDLLESIVLDDAERRRRRSNRGQTNLPSTPSWSVPSTPRTDYARSNSDPGSPQRAASPGTSPISKYQRAEYTVETTPVKSKVRSQTWADGTSPKRPTPRRPATSYRQTRTYSAKAKRSGSGSSITTDSLQTLPGDDLPGAVSPNLLPPSKWQRLVYLSLADNGLTFLSQRSLEAVAPSLRSFNLSSNLFTEIPECLFKFSKLVSLDLSNCMIDSLQTLREYPLSSLTTLKLKTNRLSSLAGIEHLQALENLHVQDNQITDPDEAARLINIPNFRKLWIKYNPLTKRFPEYRIRIMNHFRRVPGRQEDVIIDDQPASYSERKQLLERIAALELSVPSLPEPISQRVVLVQDPTKKPLPSINVNTKVANATQVQRQMSDASVRRKKGPKRRIVDLTAGDNQPPALTLNMPLADASKELQIVQISDSLSKETRGAPSDVKSPTPSTPDDMAKTLNQDLPLNNIYQIEVEDLRRQLGSTWLTTMGEQHAQWQSDSDLPTLKSVHQQPKLHHYHSTPPVIEVRAQEV